MDGLIDRLKRNSVLVEKTIVVYTQGCGERKEEMARER